MRSRRGHRTEIGGGTSSEDDASVKDTTRSSSTMTSSPFGSGMRGRKGKNATPSSSSSGMHLPIHSGGVASSSNDENGGKIHGKSLFFRPRHRRESANAVIFTILFLVGVIVYLVRGNDRISQAFVTHRVANPGWGQHPRVTELEKLMVRDSSPATALVVNLPAQQMQGGSFPVTGLASKKFLKHLLDSEEYDDLRSDAFETETCKAQYDWQLTSFPSCNHLHERALTTIPLVGHGYWRDVVRTTTPEQRNVLLRLFLSFFW